MLYNNSCTKIALVLLVSLLVGGATIGQTLTDYSFTASSGAFIPLTGATIPTLTGGSLDDGYYDNLPIGFTFNYLGVGYTIFSTTTNGSLVLGSAAGASMITNNLTSGTPRPVLGPLWDDLDQETFGTFSYKTEGTAPNRILTAEWLNFAWNYTATVPVVSFQVKLYEASGKIEFIYREESGAIAGTPSASIGISAVGTGTGNFLSLDGTGPAPNVSSTIETTTLSTKPATGQIYAFAPIPYPNIAHTPLTNTTSTGPRLVSAVITSSIGLAGSPNQPRVYYRIGSSGAYTALTMTIATGDTWQASIPGQPGGTLVQYYIAAQDTSIPPLVRTAPVGGSGFNPPGTTPPSTPYSYYIQGTISGTKYIVSGVTGQDTYPSFTAAINDLNASIIGTGGVTFKVPANQTFNERPPAITATGSLIAPIVFEEDGIGTNPIIQPNTVGTIATATDGANGDAVIKIVGGDYITFNAIDVRCLISGSQAERTEYGYMLVKFSGTDACKNVTIRDCNITLLNTTLYSAGIIVSNLDGTGAAVTVTSTGGRSENIRIFNNAISNVWSGIQVRGFNAPSPYDFFDQNIEVGVLGGNSISNYGSGSVSLWAIYAIYQNNLRINNNTITGTSAATGVVRGIFTSTGVNANVDIIGNKVSISSAATTSGLFPIENAMGGSGTTNTININNNVVYNCAFTTATTGAFSAIVNSASAFRVNIIGDTVRGNVLTGTGTFTGIDGGSPTHLFMNNNCVFNNKKTGASGTIFCTRASTSIIRYNNNRVYTCSIPSTSGTGAAYIYGYYNLGLPTVESLAFNNIYDLRISGTTTSTSTLINGIYTWTTATAVKNIYNNNIYGLSSHIGTVAGIRNNAGTTVNIFNNKIYDLSCGATGGTVDGLNLTTTTTTNVYNNFISDLRATAATADNAIRGINYISTTTGNVLNAYYNSVYLNQTSGVVNFGSSAISVTSINPTINLRNNVFVNTSTAFGTGKTVAHRRLAVGLTNYAATSNNNCFYAGTASASNLIFFDGTNSDQTLASYKARVSPRDAQSVTELPPFVNITTPPYDLHINSTIATRLESGAQPITGIVTDIDGDIRVGSSKINTNVAPDIGADEFSGIPIDETGPVITYTPLLNTGSLSNRTLTAMITDVISGVSVEPGRRPTLFFNKNRGSWYQDSLYAPPYTFTFDHSKVGGVVAGDTIFYYVQATDSSGNVSVNPSAAPTISNFYIITQASLAGDYTVGLAEFNKLTGRNIYFEKSVRKVIREIRVPVIMASSNEQSTSAFDTKSNVQPADAVELPTHIERVEVEEISWIPMENGKPYTGDLYVKASENPEARFAPGIRGVYPTITAAVADLNLRGVSGPVNFLLVDATYPTETYPIIIDVTNEMKPTATNRVTIKPNTDITATISGASASSQIFRIVSSYITIDGSNSGGATRNLTIQNTSTTTPQVISITPSGTTPTVGVTIKNCIIINGANTSTAVVVGNPGYFNNITIQNNSIQLAYIGIYALATVASGNGSGTLITENDLNTLSPNAIRLVGVYVQGCDGAMVSNNNIGRFTVVDASNVTGIWFATATVNSTISGNTIDSINGGATGAPRGIVVTSGLTNSNIIVSANTISRIWCAYSSPPYGIYVFSTTHSVLIEKNKLSNINNTHTSGYGARGIHIATGIVPSNIAIINNFVWNLWATSDASTTYWGIGIGIEGATGGIGVYYNSVNLFGSYAGYASATVHAAFAVITSTASMLDVRNNIFVNSFDNTNSTTDKSYAINSQAPASAFVNINYNDYFVAGAPGVLGFLVSDQTTLPAWRVASGQDANSISANPLFTSNTDLHIPLTVLSPVNRAATPITGITTDIDNEARNGLFPDIGADEYTPNAPVAPSLASPLNTSIDNPISGQLIWNKSAMTLYYDVKLDTLNPPTTTVSSLQTDTTYNYSLGRGKWYYWQVIAYNDTGIPFKSQLAASAIWSFRVINRDVGVTKIIAPAGTFDSLASVVPICSVYNYGTTTESYTVRMKIGGIYNNVIVITEHAPLTYKHIVFPNWAVQRGTYAVSCSTELATDMGPDNDKKSHSITVTVRDVATTMIVSPTATLLHGTSSPVRAKVKNYGTNTESFTARFKIGTLYNEAVMVMELATNEEREIIFPNWSAIECSHAMSCSTELATDQQNGNNKLTGSIIVQRHDVGPIQLISPVGTVYGGNNVIPRVKVRNFGYHTTETFNVTFKIGLAYTSTKTVTELGPRDSTIVTFDPWIAEIGMYNLITYSALGTDQTRSNDTLSSSLVVLPPVDNVGTIAILAPLDTILEGVNVTPRAIVKNFGSNPATFGVRFKIGSLYNHFVTVTNLPSDSQRIVTFPTWTPLRCNYVVSCSTEFAADVVPEDDKITEPLTVKYVYIAIVSILAPPDTVITCNDYTPAVLIQNYSIHDWPALCSVKVRLMRYPAQMTSYCQIGPTPTAEVVYESWIVTELAMGEVDTLYFPDWHPYWWDIYWAGYPGSIRHEIVAEVHYGYPLEEGMTLSKHIIAKGCPNDLQMNWTGLLDANMPMHSETLLIQTYNVASVVSNSPFGPTARFRTRVKIIKENSLTTVYSRYVDLVLPAQTYSCVAFPSGWTPADTGWYLVNSWLEAQTGVDVVDSNNVREKRYYLTYEPVANARGETNQSVQNNTLTNIPKTFGLMANQPNPFSNQTTIQWQIPIKSQVVITIYDATGRIVKNLVNNEFTTGYYNTTWNRTDNTNHRVPAGIYFYEMRTANYTSRHKMIITN